MPGVSKCFERVGYHRLSLWSVSARQVPFEQGGQPHARLHQSLPNNADAPGFVAWREIRRLCRLRVLIAEVLEWDAAIGLPGGLVRLPGDLLHRRPWPPRRRIFVDAYHQIGRERPLGDEAVEWPRGRVEEHKTLRAGTYDCTEGSP